VAAQGGGRGWRIRRDRTREEDSFDHGLLTVSGSSRKRGCGDGKKEVYTEISSKFKGEACGWWPERDITRNVKSSSAAVTGKGMWVVARNGYRSDKKSSYLWVHGLLAVRRGYRESGGGESIVVKNNDQSTYQQPGCSAWMLVVRGDHRG